MSDLVSPGWIADLVQSYGLWILFGVVMLESMGVPMPGETALVSSALYSCATHRIDITAVVGVAAASIPRAPSSHSSQARP